MAALGRIAKILAGLAIGLAAILVIVLGAAQTRPARDYLAARAAAALSGEGRTARVGTIDGMVPFDMRLDELRLADAAGEFLVLRNLAFAMAPRALLRGRVEITHLGADEIALARPPAAQPASTAGPMNLLDMLHLPFALVLDDLSIGAIRLGASVLGEPVALAVSGTSALAGDEASARVAIRRIDGAAGEADLSLAVTGRPARLQLALDIAEPSGLLLDRMLARADRLPLTASLKGEGPLADWRGVLAASAGDLARLDAELTIAVADDYRLGVRGSVAAAKLLPPALAPLLGDELTFAVRLRDTDAGIVSIETLSVATAAATLEGSLQYDGRDKSLAATATLAAADLAPFSGAAGMALTGAGQLRLTASGTSQRPQVELAAEATAAQAEGNGAAQARAQLRLASQGDLDDPATRWAISGEGRIDKVALASGDIPAGLGDALTWHVAGSADNGGEMIEIDDLGVTSAGLDLAATATIRGHFATIAGKASLAIADLAPFSALAGQALTGHGRLDLVAETTDGTTTAHLSGGFAGLTLGDPVDALLGGSLAIAGSARRSADGSIALDKLELTAADAALAAHGTLAADRRVSVTLKLDLPKLAPLGRGMAGRLGLQATAEGTLDAPAIAATLDGDGIVAGQARLDRLHATLRLADPAASAGRLDATFRAGTLDGTLGADLARQQDGAVLDIAKLRLAAAGSSLEGGLRIALDNYLANGTITGRVADLAPWSTLAGMKLAGRADLKAVLAGKTGPSKTEQGVELTLNGSGIKAASQPGSTIALARLAVSARLDNLLGTPSGHASIDLGRGEMGAVKLAALSAKLDSTKPGRFAFTGEARGSLHEKFALTTAGEVTAAERQGENRAVTLRLTRLGGDLAGETVQLTQPLTVTQRGADLAVANLALSLGAGQLAGSVSLKGEALALALKAQRLPVGLAGKFAGRPDVAGTLSFDAELGGTRARPVGHFVVDGRDLRLAAANRSDLPSLGVTADAVWRAGRVDVKGRIAGPKNEAIGFAGAAPLEMVPGALAVRLPPGGAVSLKLEGEGQIADLEELLPLGEDRLSGKFSLDVSVAGTVAQPRASGALRIAAGHYESRAAGTVLDDVAFDLVGDRERFVLRDFRATDGEQGKLTASGSVDLAASQGPALDAAIDVKSFRVLRRDDANLLAGGDIRVNGPLNSLRVVSHLHVDHGELRPPDRLPPSVASLDIVEVNSVTGQQAPPPPEKRDAPMLAATLDITIELPGQVFVRGRGLDSEWRGKLAISGTSAEPIVTGTLSVVRGTFSLLGKDFKLTSGTIGFNGDTKIDPTIMIVAEVSTVDITATVTIAGTASAPTLKLGSVPELPQDEVLARVLFGKNVGQITPAQGLQIAAAAASLAGGGGGLLDKVRSALGLDRFDFGSGNTANNAAGNASGNPASQGLGAATISAGKYIANGVYVGVDQGASSGASRGKVEIEIAPNVSVETDLGMKGGNGLGLTWQRDY